MALALEIIPIQPTWTIMDSSKLTEYMRCPRKFFYKYILGWKHAYPNNHLEFGSAWHLAQEHLLLNAYSKESIEEAQYLFMEYYRRSFPAETDDIFKPKTPKNALQAIEDYAHKYGPTDVREFEVLFTEVAGLVNVSPEHTMAFKMDSILRYRQKSLIVSLDHKTSQRRDENWGDHWTISTQMLLYLHVLKCIYGQTTEVQMQVRSSFFYETKARGFEGVYEEHSIDKSDNQMQSWQDRTISWLNMEESDRQFLESETTDTVAMNAYPMNDTACFQFGRKCEFFDFCDAWSNPLRRCENVPISFEISFWNPLEQPEIRTIIDLTEEPTDG
jgi:CRISPR/Cas system-associated exonuclease Cas4 (RecB family)